MSSSGGQRSTNIKQKGSAMFDFDRSNFIRFLKQFPKQPGECVELVNPVNPPFDVSRIQHLVFAGMGGSAISGDILRTYLEDELPVPVAVCRDYTLPAFVNNHTLLFAISYSGNTEETLSAVEQAIDRGAMVVTISSGGRLEALAREHQMVHIRIPGGMPPRQALGYLFFAPLLILEKLELITSRQQDIQETEYILQELLDQLNSETTMGDNLAHHIAQSVYGAIPVIYAGAAFLRAVPVRWRNQFNENSKVMAFSNVFPELNHNEIMGWEGPETVNKHFRVIFLRDYQEEHPRIQHRISITQSLLREHAIPFGEVFPVGQSRLARLFSLIYLGDWASYYLAMLNEQDPTTIHSIDLLKQRLSEIPV